MTLRIEYDPARKLVNLLDGLYCVAQMTLREYNERFGSLATIELVDEWTVGPVPDGRD